VPNIIWAPPPPPPPPSLPGCAVRTKHSPPSTLSFIFETIKSKADFPCMSRKRALSEHLCLQFLAFRFCAHRLRMTFIHEVLVRTSWINCILCQRDGLTADTNHALCCDSAQGSHQTGGLGGGRAVCIHGTEYG
jgi:hypothetical protein